MRLTIPVGSAQGALDRGIPRLGNFSTEEFLASGVLGHPRVVRMQGWFLAAPRNPETKKTGIFLDFFALAIRNHYILNLKAIKSCNCNCRGFLNYFGGNKVYF